jgi:hypothetical protein
MTLSQVTDELANTQSHKNITNFISETLIMRYLPMAQMHQRVHSTKTNTIPWPESASERRLSAKLVPTFSDEGCRVVSLSLF